MSVPIRSADVLIRTKSRREVGRPSPAVNRPAGATARRALVVVFNRQRTRRIEARWLRAVAEAALRELEASGELGIHLVSAKAMTRVNWTFLCHEGSTDVITFDQGSTKSRLHGEMFISIPDAVKHAREFGTTWRQELVRYVIHGLLHLCGHDDLEPEKRRLMKREEERLVRRVVGPERPKARSK